MSQTLMKSDSGDNDEEIELVYSEDTFETDSQSCIELIKKISLVNNENELQLSRDLETICERFEYLITKWQMSPKLVESHLNRFLPLLIDIITKSEINSNQFNACFRLITRLVSCIGYKSVSRYFPTEVFWLPKVIHWSELQKSEEFNSWQTRFVLLLWLSMAVKTPFHLSKFDANSGDNNNENTIVKRIYALINKYLTVGDKSRDSAAILAGNFFSRPEVVEELLNTFMEESLLQIESLTQNASPSYLQKHFGHVIAIARLLKVAERKDIKPFSSRIIEIGVKLDTCGHELINKWKVKLIGRSALTLLTPRVAKWRYRRGKRLLAQNLLPQNVNDIIGSKMNESDDENEDEFNDIPEQIELILDSLLTSLHDLSTNVRWSSAKYVARLTNRLPKELALDVVSHVLQLCEWRDSDSSWHGCCLALAELSRRGLILTQQLPQIIDIVEKALIFDEVKGAFSVGSNVRDAACFVCWSLSRAYEPQIIEKFVHKLAPTLVCVTCFDREVNCRRAASAAIQEFVGRTQVFPHGLEVIVLTDFHALANRNHCYLEIALQLSAKPEFGKSLVEHLITKCEHWDREVREISSQSIGKLSAIVDMNSFLPKLLSNCTCLDLNSRHGSILAVAHIIGTNELKLNNDFIKQIESIALILREKKLLRGIGGEFMKCSLSVLIANCSQVLLPIISKNEVLSAWIEIVCESITSEDLTTRKEAVLAISSMTNNYLKNELDLKNKVLTQLLKFLESIKESSRIGSSKSLQLMSAEILDNKWNDYYDVMLTHINSNDFMCLSRASEITTLIEMSLKIDSITDAKKTQIFKALCLALDDRTRDTRGDIGGHVRLAAIESSLKYIKNCSDDQIIEILNLMITECVSIWQKGRDVASNAFKQIIFTRDIVGIEQHLIKSTFNESENDLFAFIELLKVKSFTYNLWRGLITSLANPTDTRVRQLVKHSLKSLDNYVLLEFLRLFEKSVNCDRLSHSCIICAHFLLTSCRTDEHFRSKVLMLSWDAIRRSLDVKKLVSAIDVFCAAIQLNSIKQSLSYLTILLCHRFPRIRSDTANQTYVALLSIEDIDEEVLSLLTETDWLSSVDDLRPIRDEICDLVAIPKPIKLSKK